MTKKESKEKRIMDILTAAIDIFIEKGYESSSMNEIAARAGISKGGLYHHFSSKDLILIYANQKLMEPCTEMLFTAHQTPTAYEGLNYYIDQYLNYWSTRKKELTFFTISMNKAITLSGISEIYEAYIENYISVLEALFQKGIDQEEFICHNPKGRAISLISALDGILVYLVLDQKIKLEESIKNFIEVFLEPLKKPH